MPIRKARMADIKGLQKLINGPAGRQELLPRSLNDLYENVRDLYVHVKDGKVDGVCALHAMWEDLAEIRSLAVHKNARNKGIGRALIKRCLSEAKKLGVKKVFALTYTPEYFAGLGFSEIDKSELPQKIWGDCLKCLKFPDCDEHAVMLRIK